MAISPFDINNVDGFGVECKFEILFFNFSDDDVAVAMEVASMLSHLSVENSRFEFL